MSSASVPFSAARTLSSTASEVMTKSAEVPGVTFSRTSLMKPSSMPTSVSAPVRAPVAAPMAAPSSGTRKMSPNSSPQKAPPSAPAPARLWSCRVLGFPRSAGQVTMAASWMLTSSSPCSRSRVASVRSAPSAVGNLQTVNVAIHPSRELGDRRRRRRGADTSQPGTGAAM